MQSQAIRSSLKQSSHCIVLDAHTVLPLVVRSLTEISDALNDYCDVWLSLSGAQPDDYLDEFPERIRDKVLLLSDEEIFDAFPHAKVTRSVTPGNVDLKLLATERKLVKNNYTHIIRLEYDVFCIQPLRATFERLGEWAIRYDLCGSYLRFLNGNNTRWRWWKSLGVPPEADLGRDSLALVPSALFFPILCTSVRFLKSFSQCIRSGWVGHYETLMPTVASLLEMDVGDLSATPNCFTRKRQFAVISKINRKTSGLTSLVLDSSVPFVHPVKTINERRYILDRLKEESNQL